MLRGTNEGLASYITENPYTIQTKRQDWKHIENSLKTSLKMDDDGGFWIRDDDAVDSYTQKGRRSSVNSSLIYCL